MVKQGTYILGIDLGSSSLGWALVDPALIGNESERSPILGMGVRVFPEGVARDTTGAEHSKNEQRRLARGHRRQIARRARRKAAVLRALVELGWWPTDPEKSEFLLRRSPYELRARGLDEALSLAEFSRVLIHLSQRRGFLSNRKADRGRAKENSDTLKEISALAEKIEASGSRTLGEYLHRHPSDGDHDRMRDRHTRRQMYEAEFEALWEAQRQFHPDELSDALKYGRRGKQPYPREPVRLKRKSGQTVLREFGLHGLIFFQRSLYWPASVVGRCDLEPREKRCERADRAAQEFRLLHEVNNLTIVPRLGEVRPLRPGERRALIDHLERKEKVEFDQIKVLLGLPDGDTFNLAAGSRRGLNGRPTDFFLANKKRFGKAWWDLAEELKDSIVRSLIDDEEEEILRKATTEWNCSQDVARALADVDLSAVSKGYASFSRVAILKLLPHLREGFPLSAREGIPSAKEKAGYLQGPQRATNADFLGPPPNSVVNPLVRQGLSEVRKVVNAIIREWGKPQEIHIELAREVQGNAEQRRKAALGMRDRERRRNEARDFALERDVKPTRDAIERYLLWKEQNEICLYSGGPISPQQLFGGDVEVEHILPHSRSLDNSLMNKALAFRSENRAKAQRTVWEWVGESNPEKFEQILQRAHLLPYEIRSRKLLKLKQKTIDLDDFVNRQLTDTAYLTSQVREYLSPLVPDSLRDLICVKGQLTAELRYRWGLNSMLRDDDANVKSREDHRHHAIDALVVALTDRRRLQQLARTRDASEEERSERLPEPWPGFRETVDEAIQRINVSHRAVRDLSGALHEETIYGPTSKPQYATEHPRPHAKCWTEKNGVFVVRKRLEDLTLEMVENIRDAAVKALVIERLQKHGIAPGSKRPIPKETWRDPLFMVRQGERKTARPSVIKKVRVLRSDLTIKPIRSGAAYVKPGNTHHIALFELPGGTPEKPKRVMEAVSMMEAYERAGRGEPLVRRNHPSNPKAKFLYSLSWGEMVKAVIRGRAGLYVFKTAASTQGQIYFVSHTDARPSGKADKFAVKANTLHGEKVTIDPLGRIRTAND